MIADDKTRILVTVPKTMKVELEKMADKELRTVSNFIVSVLRDYIDKSNEKDTL